MSLERTKAPARCCEISGVVLLSARPMPADPDRTVFRESTPCQRASERKIQTPRSKIRKNSKHPSSNERRGLERAARSGRTLRDGRPRRIGPLCLELGVYLEFGSWSLVVSAGLRPWCARL